MAQRTTFAFGHPKPAVEKILQVTLRLLQRVGETELSMRAIASAAGVSKSLLHYHFESKDELLLQLNERFLQAVVARTRKTTDQMLAQAQTGGPAVVLESIDTIWRSLESMGSLRGVVLRLAARGSVNRAVAQRIRTFYMRIHSVAIEGLARSLGRPLDDTELHAMAHLLLATVLGLQALRIFRIDPRGLKGAQDLVGALLLALGRS